MYCKDIINLIIEFYENIQYYFENKGTTTYACFQKILELYNKNIPLLSCVYNSKENNKKKGKSKSKIVNVQPEQI